MANKKNSKAVAKLRRKVIELTHDGAGEMLKQTSVELDKYKAKDIRKLERPNTLAEILAGSREKSEKQIARAKAQYETLNAKEKTGVAEKKPKRKNGHG